MRWKTICHDFFTVYALLNFQLADRTHEKGTTKNAMAKPKLISNLDALVESFDFYTTDSMSEITCELYRLTGAIIEAPGTFVRKSEVGMWAGLAGVVTCLLNERARG